MTGKEKCENLRKIRMEIAKRNNINLRIKKCSYQGGDCLGTCPKCEEEVRILEKALEMRQKDGYDIKLENIASAMVENHNNSIQLERNDALQDENMSSLMGTVPRKRWEDSIEMPAGIPASWEEPEDPLPEMPFQMEESKCQIMGIPARTKVPCIKFHVVQTHEDVILKGKPDFLVGRAHNADFVLSEQRVSRMHCYFHYRDGKWFLEDLGSRNGTKINQTKVEPHIEYALKFRDVIELAETVILLFDLQL